MKSALATLALLLVAGCTLPAAPPADASTLCFAALPAPESTWKAEKPRVRFETSMGTFVAELDEEAAPITAGNFLNLTAAGFYNGTLFHRVVHDFVIQGGDPLSKDDIPSNDGTGDPGYKIPDEFNPALRHSEIGVLSMANSGPDTGGSQFFVTLAATPHLDDRHSVFGRVVEGIDVVRAIGNVQTDALDQPFEPIRLTKVERLDPTPFEATRSADLHIIVDNKSAEAGRVVRFAVILQNTGNVRDALALDVRAPAGWTCATEPARVVSAGTGRVVFLNLTPGANASGTHEIGVRVNATSGATATTSVRVILTTLGAPVQQTDKVSANYAGVLLDGRLFDTSMERVARDPKQPKFDTIGGWSESNGYSPFSFTVGRGVIQGFTNLAKTAKVGEIVTDRIPAKDAYAYDPRGPSVYEAPLTGRDLVFELEVLSVG